MADLRVIHGDMREVLGKMVAEGEVVQSIVTDPPYGLAFMGRKWDAPANVAFQPGTWRLCFELLPPGGHLLAFSGTRTYHRMAVAIEEAGFEIRDTIAWLYGSGFPKSHNVSKGIDKTAGVEREVVGSKTLTGMLPDRENFGAGDRSNGKGMGFRAGEIDITAPATDAARQWEGWGTALKPAMELICVARKPLSGTVAANVLKYGTGAINIDGCRIWPADTDKTDTGCSLGTMAESAGSNLSMSKSGKMQTAPSQTATKSTTETKTGRTTTSETFSFLPTENTQTCTSESISAEPKTLPPDASKPGNVESDAGLIQNGLNGSGPEDAKSTIGSTPQGRWPPNVAHDGSDEVVSAFPESNNSAIGKPRSAASGDGWGMTQTGAEYADSGSAARFFYSSKADAGDRLGSKHPTVKPVDLMRWLVRLVTPPGGTVLDPFAGSGTTGMACMAEGFDCILVEREAEYVADIKARIAHVRGDDTPLFAQAAE